MERSWKSFVPMLGLFLALCVALPLGGGLALRESLGDSLGLAAAPGGNGRDAWIGIRMQNVPPQYAQQLGLRNANGVVVTRVFPKSPADEAGLVPGDVILQWNGETITNLEAAAPLINAIKPGDTLTMMVMRRGARGAEQIPVTVKSAVRPPTNVVTRWETFSQSDYTFSVKYPDHWVVDDDEEGTVVFSPPTAFDDVIQVQSVDRAPVLDEWYKQVLNATKDTPDFKILEETQITIAGQPARRVNISLKTRAGEPQMVSLVLVRPTGTTGYSLLLSADPSTYGGLVTVFDEMVKGFAITR